MPNNSDRNPKVLFLANTDWYLYNFRLPLAQHLRTMGAEVHLASPDGPYRTRLESAGFPWHPVPMDRTGIHLWSEWKTFSRLRSLYKAIEPDLVHHFTLQCVVWGTFAARTTGRSACVNALTGMGSIFHGSSIRGRMLRIPLNMLLRKALRSQRSHTIFQNPDDQRESIHSLRLDPEHTSLIRGSGVDMGRFTPIEKALTPFRVLFVGRLLKDKGILDFVRAAKSLHHSHPHLECVVAGGPDEKSLSSLTEDEVSALKSDHPYIRFLGHVEDMRDLYAQCHVSVLPSQYGEGVPRSLIEAAASGLALVATDHPGCREIVQQHMNGILVPPRDADALAHAIATLADHPDLWKSMSHQSRTIATQEFSSERVFEATLRVYHSLGCSLSPMKELT